MHFDVTQHFDAAPDRVLACYVDPDMYTSLGALGSLSAPQVVAHDRDGDRVRLQLRYHYTGDLPPGAGRVIRRDRLSWIQDTHTDLSTGRTRLEVVPDNYADRLRASATIAITEDGDGSRRVVAGELAVRVSLVGGRVEQVIVDGLREHLALEAAAVAKRLSR